MKNIKIEKEINGDKISCTFSKFFNAVIKIDYKDVMELIELLTENKSDLLANTTILVKTSKQTEKLKSLSAEKFKQLVNDKIKQLRISMNFWKDDSYNARTIEINNKQKHYFYIDDSNEITVLGIYTKFSDFIKKHTCKISSFKNLFPYVALLMSFSCSGLGLIGLSLYLSSQKNYTSTIHNICILSDICFIIFLISSFSLLFKNAYFAENKTDNKIIEYFKSQNFINTIIGAGFGAILGSIITVSITHILSK